MSHELTLNSKHEAQAAYSDDHVSILKIDDDIAAKNLRAFVQLGPNPSFKYWITVASGDAYSGDWAMADVEAAIKAHFSA